MLCSSFISKFTYLYLRLNMHKYYVKHLIVSIERFSRATETYAS